MKLSLGQLLMMKDITKVTRKMDLGPIGGQELSLQL
jgi:hypothetical protein